MDFDVFREVDKQLPQFNKALAEGLALSQLTHMKHISIDGQIKVATVNEQYINELWELASHSFPDNLKYVGYRRCGPDEEFRVVAKRKTDSKHTYDISRSDYYMVAYMFTLDGEALPDLHLFLPYVSLGGIIHIKGARYMINPVIADLGLSVSDDELFLMMNRAKLIFKKMVWGIFVNDIKENSYVMWSMVYTTKEKKANLRTTLSHYLFCKFGARETFRKLGFDPIILSMRGYEENRSAYPMEDYMVCKAIGRKNAKTKRHKDQADIVVIVPRAQWNNTVQSVVTAFLYVTDMFPGVISADDYDKPVMWRRLLGKIILGVNESDGKIINQIHVHMDSIDGYVDAMVSKWLADGGYPNITTIYELFQLIINIGPELIARGSENIASLYGKRFVINRYINSGIVNGISNSIFAMKKHVNSGKELNAQSASKLIRKNIPLNIAMRINREHSEVKSVSSASDCLIHKVTSVTLLQTDASSGSNKSPKWDPSKVLDISISEVGGHSSQPDRDPSGRSSINMCVKTDESHTIIQTPETKELLDHYQSLIKR